MGWRPGASAETRNLRSAFVGWAKEIPHGTADRPPASTALARGLCHTAGTVRGRGMTARSGGIGKQRRLGRAPEPGVSAETRSLRSVLVGWRLGVSAETRSLRSAFVEWKQGAPAETRSLRMFSWSGSLRPPHQPRRARYGDGGRPGSGGADRREAHRGRRGPGGVRALTRAAGGRRARRDRLPHRVRPREGRDRPAGRHARRRAPLDPARRRGTCGALSRGGAEEVS